MGMDYYIIYQTNGSLLVKADPPLPQNYQPGDRLFECSGYITLEAISACLRVDFDFTKIPMTLMGLIKELPNDHNPLI
jgi:hypothetical protein